MKNKSFTIVILSTVLFILTFHGFSQDEKKSKNKKDFKQSVLLSGDFINATLETSASFQSKNDVVTFKIGLEDNLGLQKSKIFFTGNGIWRITNRSGLFASYYRLHRRKTFTVQRDIPYLDRIIPKGTSTDVYFNTNVFSLGYLLTIVTDSKSFLGAYFNLYFMSLKTGVQSQGIKFNENLAIVAPLPNFGLIVSFKVTNWLWFNGKMGMFYLQLDDFTGKINDVSVSARFKVYKWVNLNLSYKVFDIYVQTYTRDIKTILDYNFRGPGLGVSLTF